MVRPGVGRVGEMMEGLQNLAVWACSGGRK